MSKRILTSAIAPATELRVVSYSRVSTTAQTEDEEGNAREDASPQMQKQRCIHHVQVQKLSYGKLSHFVEHLVDVGSGKDTRRPAYQKLLGMIARGEFDLLVATELSRLNRNTREFLELVDLCRRNNVEISIVSTPIDFSTPMGNMMISMMASMAQVEREMTGQRVSENGRARLLTEGKINVGDVILGLDRDPTPGRRGHFVRNDAELEIVRSILELFLQLPSKGQLLEELHKRGISGKVKMDGKKKGQGAKLTEHQLSIILENTKWRYRGLWRINLSKKDHPEPEKLPVSERFKEIPLPHGPLLDISLLDRVQEKMQSTYDLKKRVGKDNHVYILSSLLQTSEGARFAGQPAKDLRYRYYYCSSVKRRIRCDEIEPLVIERLKGFFLDDEVFAKMAEKAAQRRDLGLPTLRRRCDALMAELADLDGREGALREKVQASALIDDEFLSWMREQVGELRQRRQQRAHELTVLQRMLKDAERTPDLRDTRKALKELVDRFDALTRTEQREALEKVISKIEVGEKELTLVFFSSGLRDSRRTRVSLCHMDGGSDGT